MAFLARSFEVIVVGAGPAGATMAFELARRGIAVLLIERAQVPRYKLCGGGLTYRAAHQLPFDVAPIVHQKIYRVALLLNGKPRVTVQHSEPLVLMTMRDELDGFLTQRALEQGAQLCDGEAVQNVLPRDDGFQIETTAHTLHCRVLVGADGAPSKIARALGLHNQPLPGLGIEAEVAMDAAQMRAWQDAICVDLGKLRHGYGWIFPKRDHLSIGAAAERIDHATLKNYYDDFFAQQLDTTAEPAKPKGHFLLMRTRQMPIQRGRALLVGDAAGLVDPLTGEGIFYAIKSAQIGAQEIAKFLAREQNDFAKYERRIDADFMPDFASSLFLSRLIAWMPGLALNLLASSPPLQNEMCQVMRGEKNTSDAAALLGPFAFLFRIARDLAMPTHQPAK